MSSRVSVIERVAMELRQIDCEDAAEACGGTSSGDAERNWQVIAEFLREGYRRDARRLVRIIRGRVGEDGGDRDV